jgi:hypothetical protein
MLILLKMSGNNCFVSGFNCLSTNFVKLRNEFANLETDLINGEYCCNETDNETITGIGKVGEPYTLIKGTYAPGNLNGYPRDNIIAINPANPLSISNFNVEVPFSGSGAGVVLGKDHTYPLGSSIGGGILSGENNEIISGANYAVIAGGDSNTAGSSYDFIGGGLNNETNGSKNVICGGKENKSTSEYSFIGGGRNNSCSKQGAIIVGGSENINSGNDSFIGGGGDNEIKDSVVAGIVCGAENKVSVSDGPFIGTGYGNENKGEYAGIIGGTGNKILNGKHSFIGCGKANSITSEESAIIGTHCSITENNSVAMGTTGRVETKYSYVWGGGTGQTISWADNTWTARCPGGARFYTDFSNTTTGVEISAGGGSWGAISDRNMKCNIKVVDNKDILDKLSQLSVYDYNYKTQSPDIRHIGVMAQDWYKVYGLGEKDTILYPIDEAGVCISSIKELKRQIDELREEINNIKSVLI